MKRLLAIALLSGCASVAPVKPVASRLPPIPPLPSAAVRAKSAQTQPAVTETIQLPPKNLWLTWTYDGPPIQFFRVYGKSKLGEGLPWTVRAEVSTNLFVISADQIQDFFTVSAVNPDGETFAQNP